MDSKTTTGIIYALTEPENDIVRYIGQTVGKISTRYSKHICDSKHTNTHVRCWINGLIKLGLKPNIFVVDLVSISELDSAEIMYIGLFKQWGFRLTNMSEGGNVRRIHSSEMKSRISNSLKGKIQSEATKIKRKITLKNTWSNPELRELKRKQTKYLFSIGKLKPHEKGLNKGRVFPGDRDKLSASLKEYYKHNTIYNKNLRPVTMTCKCGYDVLSFNNPTEAAKTINGLTTRVTKVCRGDAKYHKGFIFRY